MNANTRLIGALEVELEEPTECAFTDLADWVLWQFPKLRGGWLCGAAHPPHPGYGWIPARIQPKKERVLLFAHAVEPLATPEEAADWIFLLAEP